MTRFEGLLTQHYKTKRRWIEDLVQRSAKVSLSVVFPLKESFGGFVWEGRTHIAPCLKDFLGRYSS